MDIVVPGDIVEYEMQNDGTGVINEIYKRNNYLSRKAPKIKGGTKRGERYEQIVASNIDNIFIVSSILMPEFNNRIIDRLLVVAHSCKINPYIIINKTDLDEDEIADCWKELYESIGYKVILTSCKKERGIDEIYHLLENKINIFWGPSGVGKSSLLNKLFSELNFKVGEVSDSTTKGKHTTVTTILREVKENTFLIDTPGIREIEPYGIKQIDLGHYFPDFEDYINNCKFHTCIHEHEPGCAVISAYEEEKISAERYESYLNMLANIEDDIYF